MAYIRPGSPGSPEWDQALIDAYYRHLYHPDPAAQASAAGYLAQIEAAGLELPGFESLETFPDVTLAQATAEQLPTYAEPGTIEEYRAAPWYLEASTTPIITRPRLDLEVDQNFGQIDGASPGETLGGSGGGMIGLLIGLGALAVAAGMLGKKR